MNPSMGFIANSVIRALFKRGIFNSGEKRLAGNNDERAIQKPKFDELDDTSNAHFLKILRDLVAEEFLKGNNSITFSKNIF